MLTKGWCFGTIVERLRNGNVLKGIGNGKNRVCQKNSVKEVTRTARTSAP